MESVSRAKAEVGVTTQPVAAGDQRCGAGAYNFQMPLHYPRYTKEDYEKMPEWKLNCVLAEYGLPITGDVEQKRKFAMGAFLWSPC